MFSEEKSAGNKIILYCNLPKSLHQTPQQINVSEFRSPDRDLNAKCPYGHYLLFAAWYKFVCGGGRGRHIWSGSSSIDYLRICLQNILALPGEGPVSMNICNKKYGQFILKLKCSFENDPSVFHNMSDTYRKNQFKWNCKDTCIVPDVNISGERLYNIWSRLCVRLFEHTAAATSLNVKCSYLILSYMGVFLNEKRIIGRLTVFCSKVECDRFSKWLLTVFINFSHSQRMQSQILLF
jgi:hypothetical protein